MQYLTKRNRLEYLACAAMVKKLKEWTESENNQLSAEEKKWLKTASTYTRKACISILKRLGKDVADRLLREAKNSELTIIPYRVVPEEDKYAVSESDLYTIADHALVICQHNNYCPINGSHKDCALYKAFIETNIPPCTTETDGCPYKL